ncbi:MAG: lysine--tRNA ligase [Thermoprotei archaeon]|nr:MAG: lysine--tRNA ligase [Thermoprotei archaeon]
MSTRGEIREIRLRKLKAVQQEGYSPYPGVVRRTHTCKEAEENFTYLSQKKRKVVLVGRIRSLRRHGGATFLHIQDGTGFFQAYFRKDRLGARRYQFFLDNFDVGDFIEIKGTLFKTIKGEKTIEAEEFRMLAKSLLPLPAKWHGLKDVEERFRKRYLDLIFNPEIKKKFEIRSEIIKEIRRFLEKEGFLEVETPILQPIYGGATAKPFKTHLNALHLDLYLRIAPELYLKRLLVGGFEKVYEIGKCFRNEGIDRQHNPDFTILEFYWAYADYQQLMKLTERMFKGLLKKLFGKLKIEYEGKEIDFTPPWPRIEFFQIFRKYTHIDLDKVDLKELKEKAKKLGVKVSSGASKGEIADEIYKKFCRPKIWNPVFLIHYPIEAKPLAKPLEDDPSKAANFQLVVAGWELVNAYSELNDPILQRKRFEEQERLFKEGLEEAQRIDEDFLEALEYGMPPAAGFGMGIDRLVALLTNSHSLREVILFPTMRAKNQ